MNIDDKVILLLVALFPKNFYLGHQGHMLKELYNVLQWTEMPSGGHFCSYGRTKSIK